MDRTAFFKACVKAIRTRNQATKSSKDTNLSILGRSRSKVTTEFGLKASDVVSMLCIFIQRIFSTDVNLRALVILMTRLLLSLVPPPPRFLSANSWFAISLFGKCSTCSEECFSLACLNLIRQSCRS